MAFDIIVINIKDPIPQGYHDVRIMRPWPLGNPFALKDFHNDAEREDALKKFKSYLWMQMQKPESPVMKLLCRYAQCSNNIALVCYCKPKPCHGDIIRDAIEYLRQNRHLIPAAWAPVQKTT